MRKHTCKRCGKGFERHRPNSKYCSRKCSHKIHEVLAKVLCKACKTEFTPKRKGAKFCSRECRYKRGHKKASTCKACLLEFMPKRKESVYCSIKCSRLPRLPEKKPQVCPHCKSTFTRKHSYVPVYCSRKCSNSALKTKSGKVNKACEKCGNELIVFPCRDRRFCSRKCYFQKLSEISRQQKAQDWKAKFGQIETLLKETMECTTS